MAFIDEEAHEDLGVEQKLQRKLPLFPKLGSDVLCAKSMFGESVTRRWRLLMFRGSIDWRLYRMSLNMLDFFYRLRTFLL